MATKQMEPGIAAALVGAGMISLLVFPQVATALRSECPLATESGTELHVKPPEAVLHAS